MIELLLILWLGANEPQAEVIRPDPHVRAHRTASEPVTETTTGGISNPWRALAECESGGRWHLDVGTYDGGLQFHPNTWNAYKSDYHPSFAHQATAEQQIEVAHRVLADQGWGAWPACSKKLGLR